MWFLIGTIKRRTRGVITFPYILHLRGQRKNARKSTKITQQKTYNCTYTYIRPPFGGTRVVEVENIKFYHGLTHCSSSTINCTLFLNNRKAHSYFTFKLDYSHNEIWYFESHLLATSDVELIKQHLRLIIDKIKRGGSADG